MLEFQFRDPYVIPSYGDDAENPCAPVTIIGPITHRRVRIIVRGNVEALAVIFEPVGFYRLFGVPVSPLAERGTEGHAVLGPDVSRLHERLGNLSSFAERTAILNGFFLDRMRITGLTPTLHGLQSLSAQGRHSSVRGISRELTISSRQLERRSLESFGVAPKMIARIARFQRALRMRGTGAATWTQIAHDCGYYDQMHMIRDFRIFAGDAPGRSFPEISPGHLINFCLD
jgi:AraC-like DNA-binding protein